MKTENAWKKYQDKKEVFDFCEEYKNFMSCCKTERECVSRMVDLAVKAGYENLEEVIASGKELKPGDKVYANNMGKTLAMYIIGEEPMEKGMRILGAHVDSPRLDLKQNPLYEDTELALLDTHYYGGVKKYQWVTLPMALHGVVVKKNGEIVQVSIGEKAEEPVVGISDLLIHLSGKQMQKNASEVVEGENLNVLIGSIPLEDQEEEPVKYALNDGQMFKAYCEKVLGLPEENIHYRENATLNNILAEVDWISKVAQAYKGDASLIVYYAGHGVPDEKSGTSYLLPVDGFGSNLATGYSLNKLYQTLGELPARNITVFMDACFSGAKRGEGMLASARGVAIKTKAEAPRGNMVVFSAATGDETAHQLEEKGHGLFTYYLLKKLQQTQGNVTLGELLEYVTKQVKRQSVVINNKLQTPTTTPSESMTATWKGVKL